MTSSFDPPTEPGGAAEAELRPVQRVAAYAVLPGTGGELLLVRASRRSALSGRWALPGGGLRHGEHPRDALARTTFAETGLRVRVGAAREVDSDVVELRHQELRLHTLRILYDVSLADGVRHPASGAWAPPAADRAADRAPERAPERAGVDLAEFVTPAEAAGRPLMPYVARLMGLPVTEMPSPVVGAAPAPPQPLPFASPGAVGSREVPRLQRNGAYAVVIEDDRMLLTRLSGGSRRWTLPGGGIDHGEDPLLAVRREVYEEAGLPLTPGVLLDVDTTHFTGRSFAGRLEDFHGVRIIYAGTVPRGLNPRVVEVDGSTEAAAWVPLQEIRHTPRTSVVDVALRHLPQR